MVGNSMTAKKNSDEEKTTQVYSPGFLTYDKHLAFEQIEHENYVMYNVRDGTLMVAESGPLTFYYDRAADTRYVPLSRCPWPLTNPKLSFVLLEEPDLWGEVHAFISDHVDVLEPELYDVLTAWVFATYIPEVWMVVPYIFAFGPVATGKTRLLEALQILAYRGIIGSNVSSASLFRGAEMWHPTIFLDETEIYNQIEHAEVIGLLNAGYRRGQYAWRVKNTEQGAELELFDVFGFKALAGIEGLAKTLESRSIMVRMMKNTRPVRFLVDQGKAEELRGKLLMWRFLKLHQLLGNREGCEGREGTIGAPPEPSQPTLDVPTVLNFADGRLIELFQPLLAVASHGYENIVNYARKVYEIRQLEEETSVEAMILNALLDSESKVEKRVILTVDVTNTLNKDISEKERFKSLSVGRIMRRLGFLPKHTRRGNGWLWDESRVKLLSMRYLPRDTVKGADRALIVPSQPSQPSQLPHDSLIPLNPVAPNEPAEKCELCGEFPVAYTFTHDGQQIRRCRKCIEMMQSKGFKFTILKEAGQP
jgi:hypothetical protein